MHKKTIIAGVIMLVGVTVSVAGPHSAQMHDSGIDFPYHPPAKQVQYMKTVPADLRKYFKGKPDKVEEWQDARFGVFLHWDPSCQITGSMSWARRGPRPHHPSDGKVTWGIPEEKYNAQYKTFNPTNFNAESWVKMAKDAGAKYITFTTKHTNGFCMFDTPTTEYCIRNTPFKRDVCKELAAACHKYGIKLFWYYSQPDWTEPSYRYPFHSKEFEEKYLEGFMYPQLRQLLTDYGKIDGVWFDGLGQYPTVWGAPQLLKMMRDLQPDLVINHRFGPRPMRMGDYDGPENEIGRFQINRPWETCYRIGGAWGYTPNAAPLSRKDAIGLLVRCAGNGGNLLLDTGPAPDGTISPSHAARFRDMGHWLQKYGEGIYATRGGPYEPGAWGCCTRSKDGNAIYLHILGQLQGEVFCLPDLPAKVVKSELLNKGGKVQAEQGDGKLKLTVSGKDIEDADIDIVVKLTLDRMAMSIPVIRSVESSLTVGATVTASSCGMSGKKITRPSAVVASSATSFDDGAFVREVWCSGRNDRQPWLKLKLKNKSRITMITIKEGRLGNDSSVADFGISAKVGGEWQEIYRGNKIGADFAVVLAEPVETDEIRIDFKGYKNRVMINAVNAFGN